MLSVETWKSIFDWGTVILAALTFVALAGALITGNILSDRQGEQLRQFDKDMTDAKSGLSAQQERAANAEKAAAEAKQIADGFRLEIAKANEHAAEANRIAEEEKLKRIQIEERMKPRSLRLGSQAMPSLQAYKGTEYTFSGVFGDEESINLLKQLDSILHSAGWIRVKPPHAYPAINVYGKQQDFAVASGLSSSIKISVDSEVPLITLQAAPADKLPAPAGAAVTLAMVLTASLSPSQEDGVKANVEPGKSMTVRIEVGRKP